MTTKRYCVMEEMEPYLWTVARNREEAYDIAEKRRKMPGVKKTWVEIR